MSEDAIAGAISRGHESGMPMSLREGQTSDSRVAILEVMMEERHRFYMQLFQSQEASFLAATRSAREAITKADSATEKRFESVNEFRGQLNDMMNNLMPRAEATSSLRSISEKVDGMQTRIDKQEGAGSGMKQSWTILVGGIAAVATVIAIYAAVAKPPDSSRLNDMVDRMNSLSQRMTTIQTPQPQQQQPSQPAK